MNLDLPSIYPITDTRLSGISHAAQVEKLIAGGASLIQLREKHASPKEFYESAASAVEIAQKHGVRVIINDRVDIALALKAHGVHLGQDDLPPEHAREILGSRAIIGFSTHSVEQARLAMRLPIDYLAIGPIFPTLSKERADALVGLEGLREVRELTRDMPLVAIGGIDMDNLPLVLEAGANSAAMIGAIVSEPANIGQRMRHFLDLSADMG